MQFNMPSFQFERDLIKREILLISVVDWKTCKPSSYLKRLYSMYLDTASVEAQPLCRL